MTLINTDGMSFIGPGSEWFWTALTGLVLAITFLAIYRQLSIARSANAFEELNRINNEWASERNTRNRLEVLVALRDGADTADLPRAAASSLADFWETVAALVRAGHVDRRLFYEDLAIICKWWWAVLAPWIRRVRIEDGEPRIDEHFEWLAGVMAEIAGKQGVGPAYDEAYLASNLDKGIKRAQDEIRLAEELRAVIVRPMSPATATTPPPDAPAEVAPGLPA